MTPSDPDLPAVLALIRAEFAYMDGLIDPPSSMHALTLSALTDLAAEAEVWVVTDPVDATVLACVILTPRPPALYLGKLAVASASRGRGLASVLVDLACARAAALDLAHVELGTRVELVANQAAFAAMGCVEVARTAHPGFDRPTSIVYHRQAAQPEGTGP